MAARRGHGEGSVYQLPDGRWVTAVSLGYVGGKRKRKVLYGKTRKEVVEKLKKLERDIDAGLQATDERQTVEQFVTHWLSDVVAQRVRPKTLHSYKQVTRLHVVPLLGSKRLTKLTPQDIQAVLSQKREEGLSPRTVAYIRAVISMMLEQALKWGLVSRNVAKLVSPPKGKGATFQPLSFAQSKHLLESIKGERFEAIYQVALLLGLRRGEVLGLKWEDVDLERRTLSIRRAVTEISGTIHISEPKTATSRRVLPLPEILAVALRARRAEQEAEWALVGKPEKEEGYLFATRNGTPYHPRNMVRAFHTLLKRAGLPRVRFHDLRHSCASFLAAANVPPRVAMEILGHSDIRLTMELYSHVFDESKREVADTMDRLFGPKEEEK